MAKKSFLKTAASMFLTESSGEQETSTFAYDVTHEDVQQPAQEITPLDAQEITQLLRRTMQTQGCKNKKKPRINMAFEPDIYDYIKDQAELQGKSMTQIVNDTLYFEMMRSKVKQLQETEKA